MLNQLMEKANEVLLFIFPCYGALTLPFASIDLIADPVCVSYVGISTLNLA